MIKQVSRCRMFSWSAALSIVLVSLWPATAFAQANSADCAIWLCLPVAFEPETCAPAEAAMIERLQEHLEPAPPFSQCRGLHSPQDHTLWAHNVTYQDCDEGYIPAAPNETLQDVADRDAPTVFYRQSRTNSTCLNTASGHRYEPTTFHFIKLKVGQDVYEHRTRVPGQILSEFIEGSVGGIR